MESTKLRSPNELLQYHPAYSVLICRDCGYAIQPTGIARHLKEIHGIFRSSRRPYMEYASGFKLAKPEDIHKTTILDFPVEHLPIIDGLRCSGPDNCSHLCASTKRMQKHWLAEHKRHGSGLNEDWQATPLQTFFRGNLLYYFTNQRKTADSLCKAPMQGQHEDQFSVIHIRDGDNITVAPNTFDGLSDADQFLLQHYVTTTSMTLVDRYATEAIWQEVVPEMAFQYPFLMHGLLSCSALHLAHQIASTRQYFLMQAHAHQDQAMPLFRHAIANVTENNSHAIMAFAHMLVIYSFATDDGEGSLLISDPSSSHPELMCQWLYFMKNGCSLLLQHIETIQNGPICSLLRSWDADISGLETVPTSVMTNHLFALIPSVNNNDGEASWSSNVRTIYTDTAAKLGNAFAVSLVLNNRNFTTWDAVRVWPMEVSAEYIDLLASAHSASLILLAHYCLLLERLEPHWYFEGRAERLLDSIMKLLELKWHDRLRNSMDYMRPRLQARSWTLPS